MSDPGGATPTPWETYTYDPNDNAGRTHPTSTLQLSGHWNTPSSIVIDPLGRTIRTTERGPDGPVITQHTYDIDGHPLTVTDPLGRPAASTVYDLTGQPWRTWLLDAGTSHLFRDTTGAVVEHRDDKGALELARFDAAHRPALGWAADHDRQHPTLRTVTIYADDTASGLTPGAAREINALGRPVAVYDEAGQATTAGYDLDGNPTSTTRRVLRPDLLLSLLPPTGTNGASWEDTSYPVDWQPAAGESITQHADTLLDETPYQVDAGFDALGRRTYSVAPIDATGARGRLDYTYGRGGGITTITLDETPYLRTTVYDAHGRRILAHLGNGVLLRYRYDPQSQRLRRLRAEHATQPDTSTWVCDGPVLQDYTYRYDPAGNILTLGDRTPGCGIPPGDPNTLDRQFSYDLLHRLVTATGRETDILPDQPWLDAPRSQDITLARAYTETYGYDSVGNLLSFRHATDTAGTGAYTRALAILAASNRLATLQVGSLTAAYGFDPCGNMKAETTSRRFEWDHANRMASFRVQAGAVEPSIYAQYRYDASGTRVVKLVRNQNGAGTFTVYLGDFERLLRSTANISTATTTHDSLHIPNGVDRIATVRRGDALPDDGLPTVTYNLSDHLGSCVAIVAANGTLINKEEYSPYGETTFGSYSRKRFRFTGQQRDEESGLSCHGRRYYAPWLTMWISADPAGLVDGSALFSYARRNPFRMVDRSGLASVATSGTEPPQRADRSNSYPTPHGELLDPRSYMDLHPGGTNSDPAAKAPSITAPGNSSSADNTAYANLKSSIDLDRKSLESRLPEVSLLPDTDSNRMELTQRWIEYDLKRAELQEFHPAKNGGMSLDHMSKDWLLVTARSFGFKDREGRADNLLLRDVDHYFAARTGEALEQVGLGHKTTKTSGGNCFPIVSLIGAAVYNLEKVIGLDVRANSHVPATPPGAYLWVSLGTFDARTDCAPSMTHPAVVEPNAWNLPREYLR